MITEPKCVMFPPPSKAALAYPTLHSLVLTGKASALLKLNGGKQKCVHATWKELAEHQASQRELAIHSDKVCTKSYSKCYFFDHCADSGRDPLRYSRHLER